MDVIIDTCVWSAVMRRRQPDLTISAELQKLFSQGRARMIGIIRQELLTGIKHENQFEILKSKLRAFVDIEITQETHEFAAELANKCIAKGFQGSHSDFLICAAAKMGKHYIYSLDQDFIGFSKVIGLNLYKP